MTTRILALCGSLRGASINRQALVAARRWAPEGCEVALWGGLADLPHFTPDLDIDGAPPPPAVAAFRAEVDAAQGLLIACPEYAHGVPGAFKNALDWLVGDLTFPGKPVALWNVAPRAIHAAAQLREILVTMSAAPVEAAALSERFDAGAPAFEARAHAALAAFAAHLRRRPDEAVG